MSGFIEFGDHDEEHGDKACHAAEDIGDGLRREDSVCPHVEDIGQQVGQRDDDKGLAQQGKEDGIVLFAQRFEDHLAGVLEDHENKGRKIQVEGGEGRLEDGLVGAENTDEKLREEAEEDPY